MPNIVGKALDEMKPYSKSIAGAIFAGLLSFQTALLDGKMEQIEWVGVAIAIVGTFIGVYAAPKNQEKLNSDA